MRTIATMERLIACLNKLPGIGRRSAQRLAFELAGRRDNLMRELSVALDEVARSTAICSKCGSITNTDANPCRLCSDPARNSSILCIVETPLDALLIEKAGSYDGRYHVLGGKISPMRGQGLDNLKLSDLRRRIVSEEFREIIIALNSDVESDATASMLKDLLGDLNVNISRPAMGLPAGGGIAYSDNLTLNKALQNRQILQSGKK